MLDGYGGTISPASATVNYGGSQTFTFTPDATFSIADVRVDGVSQGAVTSYTFSNVTAAHTLKAAFNYSTVPVKNQRTGLTYSSLQTAYTNAADGDVILCRNFRLIESFTANRAISVTVRGGSPMWRMLPEVPSSSTTSWGKWSRRPRPSTRSVIRPEPPATP